jgi:beta-galactosidase
VGWYRLDLPRRTFERRRAYLQFDAASRMAQVWLNGGRWAATPGDFRAFASM